MVVGQSPLSLSQVRVGLPRTLFSGQARALVRLRDLYIQTNQDLAAWSDDNFRIADNPDVIAHCYFGTVGGDSEDGILRPASVYSPKKRIVAIASKETGTHMPFSCANCIVR